MEQIHIREMNFAAISHMLSLLEITLDTHPNLGIII